LIPSFFYVATHCGRHIANQKSIPNDVQVTVIAEEEDSHQKLFTASFYRLGLSILFAGQRGNPANMMAAE
jgi:hypothetical protein